METQSRQSNAKVAEAFARRESAKGSSGRSEHDPDQGVTIFYSYATPVALAPGAEHVVIDARSYSVTTTKQVNALRAACQRAGDQVSTMEHEDFRAWASQLGASVERAR